MTDDIDKAAQEAAGNIRHADVFMAGFRAGAEWQASQKKFVSGSQVLRHYGAVEALEALERKNEWDVRADQDEADRDYDTIRQALEQQRVPEGWLQRVIWALDHASGMAAVHGDFEFQRALQEIIAIVPEPEQDND